MPRDADDLYRLFEALQLSAEGIEGYDDPEIVHDNCTKCEASLAIYHCVMPGFRDNESYDCPSCGERAIGTVRTTDILDIKIISEKTPAEPIVKPSKLPATDDPTEAKLGDSLKLLSTVVAAPTAPVAAKPTFIKALQENELKIFSALDSRSTSGLWMRWITRSDDELSYLRKSKTLTPIKLQQFRHSQTVVKQKLLTKTGSWSSLHKKALQDFSLLDSDSDDEMSGEEYITFTSSTFKFKGCNIDDYRYSGRVSKTTVGVLLAIPVDMPIPLLIQYGGRTGYTEFVKTPKRGLFHFPKKYSEHSGEIEHQKTGKTAGDIELFIKKFCSRRAIKFPWYSFTPYNEGLFRYQPKHIGAILLNTTLEDKEFKASAKNALTFYLALKKVSPEADCNPVFCYTERKCFSLRLIPINEMLSCFTEDEISEYWPELSAELILLTKLKTSSLTH